MASTITGRLRENPMAIVVSAFATFGGFLYGCDTGTISGILETKYFGETFGKNPTDGMWILPSNNQSLIVCILSAGTFFYALLGYPFSDYLDRRWGLIIACLIFSLGVIFQTIATATPLFSAYRWLITIGLFIAAIVNNGTKDIHSYSCSPISISIQLIWGTILALGMFLLPESPRFLVLKGRIEQAYQSQAN